MPQGIRRLARWVTAAIAVATALLGAGALAGISGTKHNLVPGGKLLPPERTADVCVFCHTPYGAENAAASPEWNPGATGSESYRVIDSMAAATHPGATSISILCLSCHDGADALSTQVTAPPRAAGGKPRWQAGAWWGTYEPASALQKGTIASAESDWSSESEIVLHGGGGQHPVGVRYGGGGLSEGAPYAPLTKEDYQRPSFRTLNGVPVWWVADTDPTGSREKTDLPLYSLAVSYGSSGETQYEPFVECASCHDPHTDAKLFLRRPNTGSALCLTCHNK